MVPRDSRKKGKRPSAVLQDSSTYPPVTDEEWEAFFRRSVSLRPHATETPPVHGSVLTGLAPGAMAAEGPVANSGLWVDADAGAEPLPAQLGAGIGVAPPLTLAKQEWQEKFLQRGHVATVVEMEPRAAPAADDAGTSVLLLGHAPTSVLAEALEQDAAGLEWRDHDDLVLLGIVLHWCLRGIPLDTRPAAVQDAIWGLAQRYSGLVGRLAALLPPR